MRQENFTRRDFLKTTGAVTATAALGGIAGCSQKPKIEGIPVGLQLYSVRTLAEEDLPGTIQKVASIGYQGVEFAGYYGYKSTEIRKFLDDNGLKCCGSHLDLNEVTGHQLEPTAEFCKTIGCDNLIVPWIPEEQRKTLDDWKKTAELFNKVADVIEPFDLKIGYHNHGHEFQPLEGEIPWYVFADNTSEKVILQLDLGNAMSGGGDALAALKKYPGRAVTVHCKEYSETNKEAIVGEGDVPWQDVLEFCRTQGGTEWFIIEEEKDVMPPMECVEKCFNNFLELKRA